MIISSEEVRLDRWTGAGSTKHHPPVSTAGAWQLRSGECGFYLFKLRTTPPQWRVAGMSWAAGDTFWMPWFYRHGDGPVDLANPPETREPEIREMMLWAVRAAVPAMSLPTRRELIQAICDALDRWPLRLR